MKKQFLNLIVLTALITPCISYASIGKSAVERAREATKAAAEQAAIEAAAVKQSRDSVANIESKVLEIQRKIEALYDALKKAFVIK